ncbi:hypothetical protein [Staphylococcus cohnii]|uniref:hypothetical protein n=1 Tax=Staphylococcus cohnii TaxID=29382 RepID=UPI0038796C74
MRNLKNNMDTSFIIANFMNIILVLLFAFGAFNHLNNFFTVIFAIITVLNAGFLVYKSIEISKKNNH